MEQNTKNNFKDAITSDFGKNIHEYLTHYIDVADTKAGVLIGLASALLGFVFSQVNFTCFPLFLLAIIFEILSISISVYAVFPRLYTGQKGYIFWDDILVFKSPELYSSAVSDLSQKDIEKDYAEQNFHISKILNEKYSAIRWSMITFAVGAILIALSILIFSF